MRLRQLLRDGGHPAHHIAHDATVEEAVQRMTERQTSALLVMNDDRPVGIFTERDVVRCYTGNRGRSFVDISVSDGMTNKLIVAAGDADVGASLQMMLQTRIKHLPVESDGRIIAMLPLQAMVQSHVEALTEELSYLQDYISDLQNAGQD